MSGNSSHDNRRLLGVGSSTFGVWQRRPKDLGLLHYAHKIGVRDIDTAPSYNSGKSELAIGHALRKFAGWRVTTKVGVPFEGQHIYGSDGKDLGTYGDSLELGMDRRAHFSELFPAKSLRYYLQESICRMGKKPPFGYLLHSVPSHMNLSPWVAELTMLKKAGLTDKIGLSVDEGVALSHLDLSWADIFQAPMSLLEEIGGSNLPKSSRVMLNRVYSGSGFSVDEALRFLSNQPYEVVILTGTRHFTRLRKYKSSVDRTKMAIL